MAKSFSVTGAAKPDAIAATLAEARLAIPSASGGVVFVTGALAQDLEGVARRVRAEWKGVPALIVPAAGVLTERGELEGEDAASGLLWSGGRTEVVAVGDRPPALGDALREALSATPGDKGATVLLFARQDALPPATLEALDGVAPKACILGAGAVGAAPIALASSGDFRRARAVFAVLTGMAHPVVEASPACKLLNDFATIDDVKDGMILRLGGLPALDALSHSGADLGEEAGGKAAPLVLAALAGGPVHVDPYGGAPGSEVGPPQYLVRAIRGIDPARRGVLVGPEARLGARLAFAVRDSAASRAALEQASRRVAKLALGAAPRFAFYMSCAGRGRSLYGAPDVDARILRHRFGDLPIAGMHSSFEIAPWGAGRSRMQLYTGVLALFRSPS